jgi:hypothetical protein
MTEPATRFELSQVLDVIEGINRHAGYAHATIQAIDQKLDLPIAATTELSTSWMKSARGWRTKLMLWKPT